MTHRDRGIVVALGILLVVLAVAVALPGGSASPAAAPGPSSAIASPAPSGGPGDQPVYREGTIGRPSSINPLTARTQADRDLAALVFSGLVALGPDGTYRGDLASDWTVDPKGKTWTFSIRPDARWQDGEPVTADDVVFTVGILKSPDYTGPLGASWQGVNVTALDPQTVRFELDTPIGGFLQAATVGLLPVHLLADAPVQTLADDPFSLQPVGAGPFVLTSWNAKSASLVPASSADTPAVEPSGSPDASLPAPAASDQPDASAGPDTSAGPDASSGPDASAGSGSDTAPDPSTAPGGAGSSRPQPALPGIEMTFYPDAASLADAYRAGDLDAASGLPPDVANQLAAQPGSRLLSYPRATLSAIALNLRPGATELRSPTVRHGLLAAINRKRIISEVFGGAATQADSPIPPSSWAYDRKSSKVVRYNVKKAAADLKSAGWKRLAGGWAAPGTKKPYAMELIAPDAVSNPVAMAVANAVANDWRAFGFQTTVVPLPPAQLVGDRLSRGKFQAAAIDVNIGLDPDLYPLLGSTQVAKGGSNVGGVQDVALDRALNRARAPGTLEARRAAFAKLQARLTALNYLLPIAFRNELVVMKDRVQGPTIRELGDPSDRYWDVLTWRLADGG